MWTIISLFSKLIDLLFPPQCYLCHKEGSILCDSCVASLRKSIDTPHIYIHSLYSFKDTRVKHLIHAIKYYHRRDLIRPLLGELQNYPLLIEKTCILVPIPMPTLRKYTRGYNQAEKIAQEISSIYNLDVRNDILMRPFYTKRQVTTTHRQERIHNQKKSFSVISPVQNLDIILIDDVTTTGATLEEARKTLLHFGARNVYAITLAH